mmetsp:Transcript_87295/g.224848  ORF Transcript_87295/g.224848 Transcript_87295/m.224848 type:complete len:239 (-) Transcript_87295:2656-3372(-)
MVLASAEATLDAGHLCLAALALEVSNQVDLQILRTKLRRDSLADLGQSQLVEVLNARLVHPAICAVHHGHQPVQGTLLQGLLHGIRLRLVGLLRADEGRQFPPRLLEEQVEEFQDSDETIVGHGEAGVHIHELSIDVQVHAHQVRDSKQLDLLPREAADRARLGDRPDSNHGGTQLVRRVCSAATGHEKAHSALRLVRRVHVIHLGAVGQHHLHNASCLVNLAAGRSPSSHGVDGVGA